MKLHLGWRFYRLRRAVRLAVYDFRENNDGGDWDSLASLMEWQLTEMIRTFEDCEFIDAEKDVRRMKIARHALRRLRSEMHVDMADARFPNRGRDWANRWTELEKADDETLLRNLRFMRHWWI